MATLKRRLVAVATLLALLLPALPAQAHTISGSHGNVCEGTFGFDHGIISDGGGWYHNRSRYVNTSLFYTVVQTHYQNEVRNGFVVKVAKHSTGYNYCSYSSQKHYCRPVSLGGLGCGIRPYP